MVILLGTYIVATCEVTNITVFNKRMLLQTWLQSEICAAIWKDDYYFTFDAYLQAGVKIETAHCLDAEYNKAFKSSPRERMQDKAKKGRGKARYHPLESCSDPYAKYSASRSSRPIREGSDPFAK